MWMGSSLHSSLLEERSNIFVQVKIHLLNQRQALHLRATRSPWFWSPLQMTHVPSYGMMWACIIAAGEVIGFLIDRIGECVGSQAIGGFGWLSWNEDSDGQIGGVGFFGHIVSTGHDLIELGIAV